MRFRKSQAFILKTFPYSDTSLVVHALTASEGRVHLLAKGARRASARAMQGLDPFCRAELAWAEKEGRELQTLREAALIRGNEAWRGSLARWAMGCLVFEMADRAATAGERQAALFDLLRAATAEAERLAGEGRIVKNNEKTTAANREIGAPQKDTESGARIFSALMPFAYGVLRAQGLAPQVARCVHCGATRPPFPAMDLRQGGVLCAACAAGTNVPGAPDNSNRSDEFDLSDLDIDGVTSVGPRWPLDEGMRRVMCDWLIAWRTAPRDLSPPGGPAAVRLSARQARALLGLLDCLAAEHFEGRLKSVALVAKFCLPA